MGKIISNFPFVSRRNTFSLHFYWKKLTILKKKQIFFLFYWSLWMDDVICVRRPVTQPDRARARFTRFTVWWRWSRQLISSLTSTEWWSGLRSIENTILSLTYFFFSPLNNHFPLPFSKQNRWLCSLFTFFFVLSNP